VELARSWFQNLTEQPKKLCKFSANISCNKSFPVYFKRILTSIYWDNRNVAVNACLTPVCSVHGTAVTTVEGIGSVEKGLHPAQVRGKQVSKLNYTKVEEGRIIIEI